MGKGSETARRLGGSNEVFIFLAASPLVPGRFALFCGSPLDSAPDKISILKFSPHVRGNPRQSWILGSTMWIPALWVLDFGYLLNRILIS